MQAGSDLVGWAQVCMPVNLSHEDHELRKLDVATARVEQQVCVGNYQLVFSLTCIVLGQKQERVLAHAHF